MVAVQRRNDQPHVSSSALDTLDQVADRAYAALGPCNGRLARAVAIGAKAGNANLRLVLTDLPT